MSGKPWARECGANVYVYSAKVETGSALCLTPTDALRFAVEIVEAVHGVSPALPDETDIACCGDGGVRIGALAGNGVFVMAEHDGAGGDAAFSNYDDVVALGIAVLRYAAQMKARG